MIHVEFPFFLYCNHNCFFFKNFTFDLELFAITKYGKLFAIIFLT